MDQEAAFEVKHLMKNELFYSSGRFSKSTHVLEGVSNFSSGLNPFSVINGIGIGMNKSKNYHIKVYSKGPFQFNEEFLKDAFGI